MATKTRAFALPRIAEIGTTAAKSGAKAASANIGDFERVARSGIGVEEVAKTGNCKRHWRQHQRAKDADEQSGGRGLVHGRENGMPSLEPVNSIEIRFA